MRLGNIWQVKEDNLRLFSGENGAVCQKYLFTREMASFVENRCVGRVYILVLVLGLQCCSLCIFL